MSQLRDEAEALAKALEFGVCDVAEVIAWSDAQVLREDQPPFGWLCDVSLARDLYPQDVAGMLRQCPGTPAKSNVSRLLVILLNDRLKSGTGCSSRIASLLYKLTFANEIEDLHLREIARWIWDAIDDGEAGQIQETREQVFGEMADALDRAATDAATTWSFRVGEQDNSPRRPSA
ncbi:MAG: hypothetical protein P4L85_26070 [Paludisphaera borealis]|uniref:hypothetical protein n=1 Tax=Paludisphaera borealis TaxID=1387353 RepID=UPI002849F0A1|nr:hypothetical protein [Paludisphaera borealis]MDR3622847.1 hypothetical protein [Paludisphaera borealis]